MGGGRIDYFMQDPFPLGDKKRSWAVFLSRKIPELIGLTDSPHLGESELHLGEL